MIVLLLAVAMQCRDRLNVLAVNKVWELILEEMHMIGFTTSLTLVCIVAGRETWSHSLTRMISKKPLKSLSQQLTNS